MLLPKRLMYSPFLAQMVVVRRCNLTCGYCNEFDETSDPVPTDVLKARIDRLKELGTFSLELTGGEPLMHPDIAELIRYARSLDFYKVMMISNAYLLNQKKVEELNDAGLMEMQVSVDGVMPNDVTVKVLKPMLPKLKVLAKYAKFKVVLSAVLGAAKPEEVLTVVRTGQRDGLSSARAGVARRRRANALVGRRASRVPRSAARAGAKVQRSGRLPRSLAERRQRAVQMSRRRPLPVRRRVRRHRLVLADARRLQKAAARSTRPPICATSSIRRKSARPRAPSAACARKAPTTNGAPNPTTSPAPSASPSSRAP